MGIYLSAPDTRKNSCDGEGNGMKFGASSMQGWRLNMEDAHISDCKFDENTSLFAVFDGHGGTEVAKFCGKYFGPELKKNKSYKAGDFKTALEEVFLRMDDLLRMPESQAELMTMKHEPGSNESMAGCTANVSLIHNGKVYCANSGDSRTVCWTKSGNTYQCVPLSYDHKPDGDIEKKRISKAGGFIIEGRVNGNLNLSRALGDLEYKKNFALKPEEQLISAFPDVMDRQIKKEDEFLVMGCDGIWEILNDHEICEVVAAEFKKNPTRLSVCAETVLDKSLAPDTSNGVGCDNMSCIVIKLH